MPPPTARFLGLKYPKSYSSCLIPHSPRLACIKFYAPTAQADQRVRESTQRGEESERNRTGRVATIEVNMLAQPPVRLQSVHSSGVSRWRVQSPCVRTSDQDR